MTLTPQIELFGIAFRHLSFLWPLRKTQEDPKKLGEASLYFPLVGTFFGSGLILIYILISVISKGNSSCLIVLAVMIIVFTGRQYQNCFKFVGILGHQDETENQKIENFNLALDIARVLLVFGLFMLKFLALTHLGKGWLFGMLIIVPTVSCWSKVYLCHSLSNGLPDSSEFSYMCFVRDREFWGATWFTTVIVGVFMELEGLFLLVFLSLWTAGFERWIISKQPEIFGPVVGLAMELNEVLLLLSLIVMRKGFAFSTLEGVWL